MLKADGSPFQTRQSAMLAARNKRIVAEPVQVQDGWALRRAGRGAESAQDPDMQIRTSEQNQADKRRNAEVLKQRGLNVIAGSKATSYTPDADTEIETDMAVIDAADLVVSHDEQGRVDPRYPQELQPRERDRGTSQAWIRETAGKLKPGLLAQSPTTDSGAPIVGPDAAVESGNGRAAAIRFAYRRKLKSSNLYRAMVEKEAQSAGLDTAGMKAPMLVRVRRGGVEDRAQFARTSNAPIAARMSASEQAKADVATAGT